MYGQLNTAARVTAYRFFIVYFEQDFCCLLGARAGGAQLGVCYLNVVLKVWKLYVLIFTSR
jgi:hypothetical protein